MFVRAAPTLILVVCLGGCLSATENATPQGIEDATEWTEADAGEPLVLRPELLGKQNWILVEIRAEDERIVVIQADVAFDFENPAVAPERTGACPIYSIGTVGHAASFGMAPFLVPERTFPGTVEVGPQPEFSLREGDVSVSQRARTTGFGYTDNGAFYTTLGPNSTFVAYGLPHHEAWTEAGATYRFQVGEGGYAHRVVHRGTAECLLDFEEYPEGSFLRTSQGSRATDLGVEWTVDEGLVAVVGYASDLQRSLELVAPDGSVALRNETAATTPPVRVRHRHRALQRPDRDLEPPVPHPGGDGPSPRVREHGAPGRSPRAPDRVPLRPVTADQERRPESQEAIGTAVAKVFLIHWDGEQAQSWAERLLGAGFSVGAESEDASRAYRTIRELEPDVIVANLDEEAARTHETAEAVQATDWGREIPFIFVGGDEDSWFTLREQFPDATFVEEEELPRALDSLRLDG